MFSIYAFIKRLPVIEFNEKLSFCYLIYETVSILLILVIFQIARIVFGLIIFCLSDIYAVSYTHLDVYKRQKYPHL